MYRVMIAALRNAMNSGLTRIVQNLQIARRLRPPRIAESKSARFTNASEWSDGGVAPQAFQAAIGTAAPLPERIAELLPEGSEVPTILDMRRGPWTFRDCAYPREMVRVVAFDPLAGTDPWPQIKDSVPAPALAQGLCGEERLQRFDSDSFELVLARDWVDCCLDPERAILQMLRIVKPGCYVLMEHYPNEAERVNYAGPQGWSFSTNDAGDFIIRSKAREINMTQEYRAACSIQCLTINDGEFWLVTQIRKHALQ